MKQKLPLLLGAVVFLVVVIAAIILFTRGSEQPEEVVEEPTKQRIVEPLNELPVEQRPVVSIQPQGARNLDLIVSSSQLNETAVEYELEYQAGSLLQGAFGQFELDQLPTSADILLGTCSAGGACSFHEDVQGGTLLMRFETDDPYALKADWKYVQLNAGDTQLSSRDAKFQLESDDLLSGVAVVFNGFGYPTDLPGTPTSDPYQLTTSFNLNGTGQLTLRSNQEGPQTIYGWDGTQWIAFETAVDGKTLTAEVELVELFVAVSD